MSVTPTEIMDTVKAAPVFSRKAIEESFNGIGVEWELNFRSIRADEKGFTRLSCLAYGEMFPWIYFEVLLEKYPRLKILKENEKITVKGKISEVDGHTISLVDCEIEFLQAFKKNIKSDKYISPQIINVNTQQAHFGNGDNIANDKNVTTNILNSKKHWWENSFVQLVTFAAAIASLVGYSVLHH